MCIIFKSVKSLTFENSHILTCSFFLCVRTPLVVLSLESMVSIIFEIMNLFSLSLKSMSASYLRLWIYFLIIQSMIKAKTKGWLLHILHYNELHITINMDQQKNKSFTLSIIVSMASSDKFMPDSARVAITIRLTCVISIVIDTNWNLETK